VKLRLRLRLRLLPRLLPRLQAWQKLRRSARGTRSRRARECCTLRIYRRARASHPRATPRSPQR
jgi:hypothetical protein